MNLGRREPNPEQVEQLAQLPLVDFAVAVAVDALEALTQQITHRARLRKSDAARKIATLGLLAVVACRAPADAERRAPTAALTVAPPAGSPTSPLLLHPAATGEDSRALSALPPLAGDWLERLGGASSPVFVAPPLGATAPKPLVVAVHGAGDRPEWACGGWRLAARAGAFVVCPQGSAMTRDKFAWPSPAVLAERVEGALEQARARYGEYLDQSPLMFAGFSQGATYAEPLLRRSAARFPIAILAEGGYAFARSAAFAEAFRAGGGRRVVLVCGNPSCFSNAKASRAVLEKAGVEALVVGDPEAGHNLNERMQKALQEAWPRISSPLPQDR